MSDDDPTSTSEVQNEISGTVHGAVVQAGVVHGDVYQVRDAHVHYTDGTRDQRRIHSAATAAQCPYPGLAAFETHQVGYFFGRDDLVADLLERLDRRLRTGGMQMVVAPSGAGKSSLLRAGLLPKLAETALPESDQWPTLVLTPTAAPEQHLPALTEFLDAGERVVLVVDQFEELFTLCSDDQQRRTFIDLLVQFAEPGLGLVIVGVRADFYAACADHPRLRAALQDAPLIVGPMSEPQLRETILYPSQAVGLDIEDGLVELLLRDLGAADGHEAGRLPMLAHALRVSWQQRHGHTLTVRGYQNTGGIQHAIATTADEVYTSLDETGRHDAQSLFLHLVKIGDGTEDVRRSRPRAELPATDVVDAFTQARLLTQHQDRVEITHEALLHCWPRLRRWIDTDRAGRLVWQRLHEAADTWQHDNRDPSALYRGVRLDSARQWADDHPHDLTPLAHTFLDASTAQEQTEQLAARRRTTRLRVTAVTLAALLVVAIGAVGVAVWQSQTAAEQRDVLASQAAAQAADRLRATDPTLAMQLALAAHQVADTPQARSSLFTSALTPYETLITGHTDTVGTLAVDLAHHLLASGSKDNTVRLWNIADRAHPTTTAVIHTNATASDLALSHDGRLLAVQDTATSVLLWNVTNPAKPVSVATLPTTHGSLAFSPDGHLLAAIDEDTASLWDLTDPTHPMRAGTLPNGIATLQSVAFSADSHTVAIARDPGDGNFVAELWDVTDPHNPHRVASLDDSHLLAVAFSPTGSTLAVGSNGNGATLWNTANPSAPVVSSYDSIGSGGIAGALAFSPDGNSLAVGVSASVDDNSTHITVANITDPRHPLVTARYPMPTTIRSVAYGEDSSDILSASDSKDIWRWHPTSGPTLGTGEPDVSLTPNGHILATPIDQNYQSFQLWQTSNASTATPAGVLNTASQETVVDAINDHTLLETSEHDPTRLWDITDPNHPVAGGVLNTLPGFIDHTGTFRTIDKDVATDGHVLALNGDDGLIHLWDVSNPRAPVALSTVPAQQPAGALSIASDNHVLLSTARAGANAMHAWDIADPRRPVDAAQVSANNAIDATVLHTAHDVVAFGTSPSGGGSPKAVQLWDFHDPRHPVQATLAAGVVNDLAVSNDARTLAVVADKTINLWDISDIRHPTQIANVHTERQGGVIFSDDGRLMISASGAPRAAGDSPGLHLWDVSDPHSIVEIGTATLTDDVVALGWAPTGSVIVGQHGGVHLIDPDVASLTRTLCSNAGGSITPDQWAQYFPGTTYTPPCG